MVSAFHFSSASITCLSSRLVIKAAEIFVECQKRSHLFENIGREHLLYHILRQFYRIYDITQELLCRYLIPSIFGVSGTGELSLLSSKEMGRVLFSLVIFPFLRGHIQCQLSANFCKGFYSASWHIYVTIDFNVLWFKPIFPATSFMLNLLGNALFTAVRIFSRRASAVVVSFPAAAKRKPSLPGLVCSQNPGTLPKGTP